MKLFYLRGALGDPTLLDDHSTIIDALLKGDYQSCDLEKLKGHEVYSFRINDSGRLLFTLQDIHGKKHMIVLEHLPTHDYHKSRFLQPRVLSRYLSKRTASYKELTEKEACDFERVSACALPKTEEQIQLSEVEYFERGFIELTHAQKEALQVQLPAVVSGVAGSGKTCVALSSIVSYLMKQEQASLHAGVDNNNNDDDEEEEVESVQPLRLLYVTQSPHLLSQRQEDYQALPVAQGQPGRVLFKTFDDLIRDIDDVDKQLFRNKEDFISKYNVYKEAMEKRARTTSGSIPAIDADSAYKECRIASGLTLEAYLDISHSSLPKHEGQREWLYAAYTHYAQQIKDFGVHPAFYEFQRADAQFDLIVVDEAQDFSLRQLTELRRLVRHNQIMYFMDSHQALYDSCSLRPLLLQHFKAQNIEVWHESLTMTHRCPLKIASVANAVISFKQRLHGGLIDKYESNGIERSASEQDAGHVYALTADELGTHPWLQAHIDKPYCVIVTQEAFLDEAKNLFPQSALIMTPDSVKGLEYSIVVTYKLYEPALHKQAQDKYRALTDLSQPQHQGRRDKKDDRFQNHFNAIHTSYTRATAVLIICEPEINRDNELVKCIFAMSEMTMPREFSIDKTFSGSWEEQVQIHLKAGNRHLAELICASKLNKNLDEFIRLIFEVKETEKTSMPSTAAATSLRLMQSVIVERVPLSNSPTANNVPVELKSNTSNSVQSAKGSTSKARAVNAALPHVEPSLGAKKLDIVMKTQTERHDFPLEAFQSFLMYLEKVPNEKPWEQDYADDFKRYLKDTPEALKQFVIFLARRVDLLRSRISLRPLINYLQKENYKHEHFSVRDLQKMASFVDKISNSPNVNQEIVGASLPRLAAKVGDGDLLRVLNVYGVDLKEIDFCGNTLAHIVISSAPAAQCAGALRALKNGGVDINKRNNNGRSPFQNALFSTDTEKIRTFKGLEVVFESDSNVFVLLAAAMKSKALLRDLGDLGVDFNSENNAGYTPIMLAVRAGQENMVRALIEFKVDLNKVSSSLESMTAIYLAAARGFKNLVELLVSHHANLELKTRVPWDALKMHIKETRNEDNCKDKLNDCINRANELFSEKSSEEFIDISALQVAIIFGHQDVVEFLSNKVPDMTKTGADQRFFALNRQAQDEPEKCESARSSAVGNNPM